MHNYEITKLKEQLQLKQDLLIHSESERILLQKQLNDLKAQFNDMFDFNSLPLIFLDKNYFILSANFQTACLLNYDRHQLLNLNFLYLISAFQQHVFKRCIAEVFEKKLKQTCELELLQKGNNRRQVLLECLYSNNDTIQLILKDITYIRQLESQQIQLKQSQEIYSNFLQNVPNAIATLNKDFYFILINPAFIQFFSRIFSIKIHKGMNFFSVLGDFSDYKQQMIEACHEALLGKETFVLIENNNESQEVNFCFEINFNAVFNPNSESKEIIILIKDLTDFNFKKQLILKEQSRLAHSMRLQTMEGMASALAHEMNQPLTTIFLYAQTAMRQLQKQDSIFLILDKIISQAKHATEVMKRMKSFFNQEVLFREETDVNALIQETMMFIDVESFSKLKIHLNLNENLPIIHVDRIQIMQIILNLARNSMEAMQNENKEDSELKLATYYKNDTIEIHVIDNGPGIPEEHRNKILQSYFTTKAQGTGLGLTICRNLIEAHGGKLYVNNSITGAWFVVTLPAF